MRLPLGTLLLLILHATPLAAQTRAQSWMEAANSTAVRLTMRLLRDFEVSDLRGLQELTREIDLVAFARSAPCESSDATGDYSCSGALSAPTPELCRGLLVLHLQGQIAGFSALEEFPDGAIRYSVECAGTRLGLVLDPARDSVSLRQDPLSGGEPLFDRTLSGIGPPR